MAQLCVILPKKARDLLDPCETARYCVAMHTPQTPKALLVDRILADRTGDGLHPTLVRLRRAGKTWPEIADVVSDLTGVRLSKESVRTWALSGADLHAEAAAS